MAIQRDKVITNAEKLVAKGKIESAIKEYERLLDDNPTDVNTLNRIGDLWVRINRTDEAVKVFTRIADHYGRDGFFLKAIAIYKKINKLDPSKLEVYSKLAELYAKQGLAMEAKSQYQVLADYYLKHGEPGNALGIFRRISELDPNSINVHVKLADLYSQNNQTAEALKEYDRVGKMLLKRGMLDEALQVFRKAMKIDSGNVEFAESLVGTLLEAKDYTNAIQLLQSTLETNKQNPKLVALLGRTHSAQGDLKSARDVLERGLTNNPTDATLREALSDVYLKQGAPDQALNNVSPLVETLLGKSDRAAVDPLKGILKVEPLHTPTLEKLVAAYTRLHEDSNASTALNDLIEAHIAKKEFPAAEKRLRELITREPENAQHRKKLAFVQQSMGQTPIAEPQAAPAAPPRPVSAPPVSAAAPPPEPEPEPEFDLGMEVEEPEISLEPEEEPAFDVGLNEPELSFDVETEEESINFEPEPGPVQPQESNFFEEPSFDVGTAPERAVPEDEMEPAAEDLDFVTEHLTEAEVFAKYGLSEKAIEHLQAVLSRVPKHPEAHDRLMRIYLDEGDHSRASEVASDYLTILRDTGETEFFDAVEALLATRGFGVQNGARVVVSYGTAVPRASAAPRPAAPKPAPRPAPVAPPPPPEAELINVAPEEVAIDFTVPEVPELEFDLDSITAPELPVEEPLLESLAEAAPESLPEPLPEETLDVESELSFAEEIEIPAEEAPAEEEPIEAFESLSPLEDAFQQAEVEPFAAEMLPGAPAEETIEEAYVGAPAVEELGEIDFYIEQELYDEARVKLDVLLARFPDNDEVIYRQQRLEAATAPPPPVTHPIPPAPPSVFSAADIENELMSAIPDDEDIEIYGTAQPTAQPAKPKIDETNLFADEDDFFDLAAELEHELEEEGEEQVSLSEEEQSLEDIFREFKKGVEQQLDSEDYDTHYNLGIAYKEMGLIDEAIGEFQLASKDPKRTIECCSMLGLCFLEKGMPQLAIKWYRKGLEVPEITEEEHLGLLYDIGSAYLETGDVENAHKAFVEIYGVNSNYRDIVHRIKSLEDVRR